MCLSNKEANAGASFPTADERKLASLV